jgi:hypothetical protein
MTDGISRGRLGFFLWALVALYAVARVLQLFTDSVPMLIVLGLHILPALAFGVVHGAARYRLRNSVLFLGPFFVIWNVTENIGVRETRYPSTRCARLGKLVPRNP